MVIRVIWLLSLIFVVCSCEFTETMVLNEDGTGRMELSVDMSEIMAMSGEMAQDSSMQRMDTVIAFKDILKQLGDSIATLSPSEQTRLKAMEDYHIHMFSDPGNNKFVMDVFIEFKNVAEANDLMKGFDLSSDYLQGANKEGNGNGKKDNEDDIIGVKYNYSKGHFSRDAFIRDEQQHQQQLDSLKQAESFMSGISYKLKYTFPRKIKSTTAKDAAFSLDGKTLELERTFLEYFKNPDIMDLEVELED